ncbi:DUF3969 family protein [Neisseria weaveri]|uniref:DUF3969 family protein n=1 Tax=Neisseria weaveri TaxID=28091 RepID=UPI0007C9D906|nr:DUF3969 family protein [Neisseria weaveri]SAY50795.1 Uncharacterised protein [Neisseria weaveri]
MDKILISNNKNDVEFFLNTYILGVLTALINKKINTDDIQKLLFRPGIIEYLTKLGIDKQYIHIILAGTELEDIESLIPENLHQETLKLIDICLNNFNDMYLEDNIYIGIDIKDHKLS